MPAIGEQPGKHTQSTEDLLPIGDAARLLGVSVETLRRWDRGGRISSVRTLGGQRRFRRGDIDRVGTDPETWRAADRMIDDAQGADS